MALQYQIDAARPYTESWDRTRLLRRSLAELQAEEAMSEERRPPRISDAPGLVWKPRKDGWEARWYARADLVQRGYTPKSIALWTGSEPNEFQRAWISDRCGIFQREMLTWGRGAQPVVGRFDGTLKSLIACYQTDPDFKLSDAALQDARAL